MTIQLPQQASSEFINDIVEIAIRNYDQQQLIELPSLHYARVGEISKDSIKDFLLVRALLSKGFKIMSSNNGEFKEGKFQSFYLTQGKCDCQVHKIYIPTKSLDFRIKETILCKKAFR